jgi:hypothetical protein
LVPPSSNEHRFPLTHARDPLAELAARFLATLRD